MSRQEFVTRYLESMIDSGVNIRDMRKIASLSADALEALQESGRDIPEVLEICKQANPGATAAVATIGDRIMSGAGMIGSKLTGAASGVAQGVSGPLALAALLAPMAVGYQGGKLVGQAGDSSEGLKEELDRRELIAELRNQTARLRANQRNSRERN